jgi:NNP family nitrate/nitrite transporter-like MFS transporter
VPLRWPASTAVAGSMIGEIGALGGGLVPYSMGLSKQYYGTYLWGFVLFAVLASGVLLMMRSMQLRWTRTWAEKGGRARTLPVERELPQAMTRIRGARPRLR